MSPTSTVAARAKSGRPAGSVRFSPQEEQWLKEAYKLFGKDGNRGWCRKALERFPFHPTRTAASLKQKWHGLNK